MSDPLAGSFEARLDRRLQRSEKGCDGLHEKKKPVGPVGELNEAEAPVKTGGRVIDSVNRNGGGGDLRGLRLWRIEPLGPHHDRAVFSCGNYSLDRYL